MSFAEHCKPNELLRRNGDVRSYRDWDIGSEAGKEAEAEKLLTDLLEPSHREEGCILFALHRGIDAPRLFAFVERWATRELNEKHLTSEYFQSQLKLVPELFSEGPNVTYYEAVPGGDPEKGSLAEHAGSHSTTA